MSGSATLIGLSPTGHAAITGHEPGGRAATALSIVVHACLIGLLWRLAMHGPPPPPPQAAVTMLFETAEAPAQPQALSAATLAAQSSSTPDSLTVTLPRLVVKATAPPARPLAAAAPPARPATAVDAATIAPPRPAGASQGDITGLKLRIREAVRVATAYPAVARQMHREGHAQVSFDYIDGTAQDVSLAHSSQSRLLDEAALSAVRRATYPRPLPGMEGMRLNLMVWVNFGLENE